MEGRIVHGGRHTGSIRAVIALLMAGIVTPAAAHDFWIEPSTYRPPVGRAVGVGLRVGDHFEGRPVARTPDRIARFVSIGPGWERPIPGRTGADPAGVIRPTEAGTYVLGYRSRRAFTEMEAVRFEDYVKEKGLEPILARSARPSRGGRKIREAYSRCSKSLIRVGDAAGGGDRPIGFTLEIVSGSDPYGGTPGSALSFRVLHEGGPIEGVLVTATRRASSIPPQSARTDDEGRVTFTLDQAGIWLISCVHMVRAPVGLDAEWESLWASLTFELPSARTDGAEDPA